MTLLTLLLGYKLRKHIAQALSRRCTAIRNAIDRYNALAPLQKPPRPHLEYTQVVDYCNFSEFEILKHTDHNLLSKPWAILANRQAANKYFKLERAKEEIHRCNVEVARVQAWVDAEDAELSQAVAAYEGQDAAFAAHLKVVQMQRKRLNDRLRTRLSQISNLPGYSGSPLTVAASPVSPTLRDNCKSLLLHTPARKKLTSSFNIATRVREGHHDNNNASDDEDELHDEVKEDELSQMMDTLAHIVV
jgi:hypothetical protein